jgi:hypothetical protein
MEAGAILSLAAVLLIVCAVVFRPFMPGLKHANQGRRNRLSTSQQASIWLAEKERLLTMIQELEFDHETGKIPDDLFKEQRIELVRSAADILKKLDQMGYSDPKPDQTGSKGASAPGTKEYDDLDELIARRKLEKNGKATGFCPKCGNALQSKDHFCPKCGMTIQAAK